MQNDNNKQQEGSRAVPTTIAELRDLADVHSKDWGRTFAKIKAMREDGAEKLQLLTDFDRTLTKYQKDGCHCPCSYAYIEESETLSDELTRKCLELKAKYLPIEMDATIPPADKLHHMEDWWGSVNKCLIEGKVTLDAVEQMVKKVGTHFREGVDGLIDLAFLRDIPVLIFSAGLGDIINEMLRVRLLSRENIKVVANFMDFDEDGYIQGVGFHGQGIHTFNKKDMVVQFENDQFHGRSNIILLGDATGDSDMVSGVSDVKNCLKIGYLNEYVEKNLPVYLDLFDIVLTDDGDLSLPAQIMDFISSK